MGRMKILKSGGMTSIQDSGRKGKAYFAIPRSGAMDQKSLRLGQLLLDLPEDGPGLECTLVAPTILFESKTRIALTGADFNWTINGGSVALNTVIQINEGDVLSGKNAEIGLRGYIIVDGEIEAQINHGSKSTYKEGSLGGLNGQFLKPNDTVTWENCNVHQSDVINIHLGPEWNFLTREAQEQLLNSDFQITTDSNRMGARLNGPGLKLIHQEMSSSVPVFPGIIQLPSSGQPIVVLQDGQTTGGYPRIAYIRTRDLDKFNQIGLNQPFRFVLGN